MPKRGPKGRKLLVAALGVAAVSYAGCRSSAQTTGNLVPPPPRDSGTQPEGAAAKTEVAAPDAGPR